MSNLDARTIACTKQLRLNVPRSNTACKHIEHLQMWVNTRDVHACTHATRSSLATNLLLHATNACTACSTCNDKAHEMPIHTIEYFVTCMQKKCIDLQPTLESHVFLHAVQPLLMHCSWSQVHSVDRPTTQNMHAKKVGSLDSEQRHTYPCMQDRTAYLSKL